MAEPRAETVGSLLRSQAITSAARRGSLADQQVLDDAMIDAVRLQEEAGLDVITDGEVRRTTWAQTPRFLDCFTPDATRTGDGCPVVTGRVRDAGRLGDLAADYECLARYLTGRGGTPPRAKFTMPAPSYHRRYWSGERSKAAYGSAEEYLAEIRDYLREVADSLIAIGCDYIQLDAPNYGALCDPGTRARLADQGRDLAAGLAFDAELDNSLFDGVTGVTTALHICRGNGSGGPADGYAAISGELFPRLRFGRLLLDYDRADGFESLEDVRDGTVVVLGLLTTDSDNLDDEPAIESRITEAARRKPLPELALSTRCGFAPVPSATPVTPAGQRAKLEMVARVARRIWS